MGRRLCLVVLFSFFVCTGLQASNFECSTSGKAILSKDSGANHFTNTVPDTVHVRKHKLIAALLAFPLGVFGLHRMYLGSSAGVPIAYIATFGGAVGVLPFIDFVLILLSKDVNQYAYNPHIYMWSRPVKKHKH